MQKWILQNKLKNQTKWKTIYVGFITTLFTTILLSNASGPAFNGNGGQTGAPGEGQCSNCHGGGTFTPNVSIQIFENGTSTPATSYVGGNTYDVRVTVSSTTGVPRFGFQLTALKPTNTVAGTFNTPSSNTRTISTGGRNYIEQNARSNSGVFSAKWVAPASGSGLITFYASGNCVNANGSTSQDNATTTTASLPEFTIPLSAAISVFSGHLQANNSALLQWETSAEQNNAYYTIQRSQDAQHFTELGKIPSKASQGESAQILSYEFLDAQPLPGQNYYRLLQTDLDGKTQATHQLIQINNSLNVGIDVYPNPCSDVLMVRNTQSTPLRIRLMDISGQMIQEVNLAANELVSKFNVAHLPHGIYSLQIEQQNHSIQSLKIFK